MKTIKETIPGINEFQIKCVLILLMLFDHLHYIDGLIPQNMSHFFNIISRGVAPAFAYFAIEGIRHTKNLKLYNLRLFFAASIMEIGNRILNYIIVNNSFNEIPVNYLISNNILWTLFWGVFGVSLLIWSKKNKTRMRYLILIIAAACWGVMFYLCEWGVVLAPFIAATYLFKNNKKKLYISYIAIEFIAILFRSEILYFFVMPFIWIYNGKRGRNNQFTKYFFYFFYPLHLWIIYIINYFMNVK